MSTRTGSEVYRDLQQHAAAARAEVTRVADELQTVEQRVQELVHQRADSIQRLAQHYLPALDDRSIAGTVDTAAEVQAQLRAVQDRQRAAVARLRSEGAALTQTLAAHDETLRALTARLDACVERRGELEAQAARLLELDPGFKALATRAAETERALARDEERAQEIAREAAEKLPAYERSTLFQYLVKRNFGSADYRSSGLTRRLDRWVANLVDYARAKPGYDFLRVTPEIVAAEVKRRREDFEPVMQELHDKQDKAAEQVGLPTVLRAGAVAGAERDALVQAMTAAQQNHRKVSEDLATAESSEGQYHTEALATLRAFLARTETRVLEQRARATPEPQDDALVTEIGHARREETGLTARLQTLTAQRTDLDARAVGLERLVRRFREANFDATRSRFAGIDLESAVSGLRAGSRTVDDVWSHLRSKQEFERTVAPVQVGGGFGTSELGTGSRVLLEAMGHVVGAALRGAAHRSVFRSGMPRIDFGIGRRSGGGGGGRGGGGGFTRGAGF